MYVIRRTVSSRHPSSPVSRIGATPRPLNPREEAIKIRSLFALVGLAIGFTVLTFAQQHDTAAPPESEQSKRIVALVEKAATLIDSKGKSIFPEFRKTGSEWLTGDTYLFVDDLKGNILFNGGFPKTEGTNDKVRPQMLSGRNFLI